MSGLLSWTSYASNVTYSSTASTLYSNTYTFFNNNPAVNKTGTVSALQINSTATPETPSFTTFTGAILNTAIKFSGFFRPNQTGSWTFNIAATVGTSANNADDVAMLFLGTPGSTIVPNSSYTSLSTAPSNTHPIIFNNYENNLSTSNIQSVTLTAGQYYPILYYYSQSIGGYTLALSFKFNTAPSYTTDFTNYMFTSVPRSGYYVNNVDISNVIQKYTTGTFGTTKTRFYSNNIDIGDLYQTFSLGTVTKTNLISGTSDLSVLFQPILSLAATSNLNHYYNFISSSPASYSGSGTSVTNLITSAADMTLYNTPTWNSTTRTMRFTNTSATGGSNIQYMQKGTNNVDFKSVSIFYKQYAKPTAHTYIFDGRNTSNANDSYIWSGGMSSFWENLYRDGGVSITPSWSGAEFTDNTWHNLTYTSSKTLSPLGSLTFPARFSQNEGANIEIAIILVYTKQLTQAENLQNYQYIKYNFMSTFSLP